MGISSYILLDVPANLFEGLISSDEFIEISQQTQLCSCNERLYKNFKHCPNCTAKVNKTIFNETKKSGNAEKIFNEAFALYLSLKKEYPDYKANYEEDQLFNDEMDIFLVKDTYTKIIEGTVKMELDKDYIIDKTKTLVLIENLLKVESDKSNAPLRKCEIIIWGINEPENITELESIPLRIFGDNKKIFIVPSGFSLDGTNKLEINIKELNGLKTGFNKIVDGILDKI